VVVQMTHRERVRTAIARQQPDRVPIMDQAWRETVRRWRREGMPEDVDIFDYFDFAIREIWCDTSPRFPVKVISENDEHIVSTTNWGATLKQSKTSSNPHIMDTLLKKKEDWPAIKERLQPDEARKIWIYTDDFETDAGRARYRKWRDEERYVVFCALTGYDQLQWLIPAEKLFMYMATDPEWIREIADTVINLFISQLQLARSRGLTIDAVWTCNDMGYRNGPLFSPQMYRDIFQPGDKRLWETAHSLGMQTILHCCGNIMPLIPDLIDAGLDCYEAIEAKAGMDVVELKKQFGDRLSFMGNINAQIMGAPDPAVIEEEIRRKVGFAKQGGGYIYHSDHSVPDTVSLKRYRYILELVKKYGSYTDSP